MGQVYLTLGYDDERPYGDYAKTDSGRDFLERKIDFLFRFNELFNEHEVPRTHFILGAYLQELIDSKSESLAKEIYDDSNPLLEIAQHSYSHPIIRKLDDQDKEPVTSATFLRDVDRAYDLISDVLDAPHMGMRIPCGYDRDLSDKPMITKGLWGIQSFNYISSNLRDSSASIHASLNMNRQPTVYFREGDFEGFVEVPSHGLQDVIFLPEKADMFPNDLERYFRGDIDNSGDILSHYTDLIRQGGMLAKENDCDVAVSLCMHPWAIMEYDNDLLMHQGLLRNAQALGAKIVMYRELAQKILDGDFKLKDSN